MTTKVFFVGVACDLATAILFWSLWLHSRRSSPRIQRIYRCPGHCITLSGSIMALPSFLVCEWFPCCPFCLSSGIYIYICIYLPLDFRMFSLLCSRHITRTCNHVPQLHFVLVHIEDVGSHFVPRRSSGSSVHRFIEHLKKKKVIGRFFAH